MHFLICLMRAVCLATQIHLDLIMETAVHCDAYKNYVYKYKCVQSSTLAVKTGYLFEFLFRRFAK
jgi:hypothetical protein